MREQCSRKKAMTIKEMKNERLKMVAQMRALSEGAAKAGRLMTADENAKWDRLDREQEKLAAEITRQDKLHDVEAELNGTKAPRLSNINSRHTHHFDEDDERF